MRLSKFFLVILTFLIGMIAQLIPFLLSMDSPMSSIGFPLTFLWEGPNDVYVGAYSYQKAHGFLLSNFIINCLFFIGCAFGIDLWYKFKTAGRL